MPPGAIVSRSEEVPHVNRRGHIELNAVPAILVILI